MPVNVSKQEQGGSRNRSGWWQRNWKHGNVNERKLRGMTKERASERCKKVLLPLTRMMIWGTGRYLPPQCDGLRNHRNLEERLIIHFRDDRRCTLQTTIMSKSKKTGVLPLRMITHVERLPKGKKI
jgi:hypothetical protein